jgi:hypothetical protein
VKKGTSVTFSRFINELMGYTMQDNPLFFFSKIQNASQITINDIHYLASVVVFVS